MCDSACWWRRIVQNTKIFEVILIIFESSPIQNRILIFDTLVSAK